MNPNPNPNLNILCGDALTQLQTLEPESVDCCISSPPYWALRDYKCDGQLGLEPTFVEYINKLVTIFDEVKRVLKKTGSCWVVIGDTYNASKAGNTNVRCKANSQEFNKLETSELPTKSLCLIPERFAISMVDHGWILRNKIVWFKPNCMPSSAKDRFTVDWECVFFFVKQQKYFFETQYEPALNPEDDVRRAIKTSKYNIKNSYFGKHYHNNKQTEQQIRAQMALGRIKRCVWKISTKPFSGAHFAVFPPQLVEPMIRAGSPEYICNKCQEPRKLQYEETRIATRPGFDVGNGKSGHTDDPNGALHRSDLSKYRQQIIRNNQMLSDCGCNAGFHSSVVLDPFMGSGTVGLVALQNARNFIGIELNPDYIQLARKRLAPFIGQERLVPFVTATTTRES